MLIINTRDNLKMKSPLKRIWFLAAILIFAFPVLGNLAGCTKKDELKEAQGYLRQSRDYYSRAVELYKGLIAKGNDTDRLHFELGRLYYDHGEFKEAAEEFKKTPGPQAKKFLAISYYRMGSFTDALGAFGGNDIPDDEYLYYYGLTCEKLNLFDQAVGIYKKIKTKDFSLQALQRIDAIEKESGSKDIEEADSRIGQVLKNAPSGQDYPQAGALILFCDEKIEVTAGNTQVSTLHYVVKILNERGKGDFSEAKIDYDSTYEKIELEYARTIKPDGTVMEVGSRHIRDVSKYLNFPLYSNARAYIISFPGITEGSSIEYKVKIYRNQLVNKKDFITGYPVQAQEPIIAADLSIILPGDKQLQLKTFNDRYNDFGADLKPRVQKEEGRVIYRWQFRDIPQIIPESDMPPYAEINPTILISTFSSWQEVYDWWWALAEDKIKIDAAIKDKVRELTDGMVSDEEKMRAIYNFCAQKIRYVAVEYGQAGYEPHTAADIFRNKYGDCKDQAILLVTMLKEAGFTAYPVLIPTRDSYNLNADFPAIFFNHCIAAVSLAGEDIFLDPTAETCAFRDLPEDDQGRSVLVFKDKEYQIQTTPIYPAEHNLMKQRMEIKINSDEAISARKEILTHGVYEQAQRYWLLYTPPDLIQEALQEKIQTISIGARLDKYRMDNLQDLNKPLLFSYSFHGPEYLTLAGKNRIMPQLASLDTSLTAKDRRRYPLDFSILDTQEMEIESEIPENFSIKYMPPNIDEDNRWLKFIVEYNKKDNKIYFRQGVVLKKNIVPQEDYPEFKAVFEDLARRLKQRIVLEKS